MVRIADATITPSGWISTRMGRLRPEQLVQALGDNVKSIVQDTVQKVDMHVLTLSWCAVLIC